MKRKKENKKSQLNRKKKMAAATLARPSDDFSKEAVGSNFRVP